MIKQLLREAQQITDTQLNNNLSERKIQKKNFVGYFEEFKGSIHLEALEMLSAQASSGLDILVSNKIIYSKYKTTMNHVESEFFDAKMLIDEENDNEGIFGLYCCLIKLLFFIIF